MLETGGIVNNFKIYYLTTETDNLIPRYVGQTKRSLKERLQDHISTALYKKDGIRARKNKWIRDRIQNGDKILINLIEDNIQTFEEIIAKEIFYIKKYENNDLTNGNKGGSVRKIYETDDQIKKKISDSQKRRLSKPIIVLDKEQKIIHEFDSLIECTKHLKVKSDTVIGNLQDKTYSKTNIYVYKKDFDGSKDYSYKLFTNKLMSRKQSPEVVKKRNENNYKKVKLINKCENWEKDFISIKDLCSYFNLNSNKFHSALIYKKTHKEKYKCFQVIYDKDIVRSSEKSETNKDNN